MEQILKKIGLLWVALLAVGVAARAQYYNTGTSRGALRYEQITTDSVSLIAPDYYQNSARRVLHYMNAVRDDIDFGLGFGVGSVPVVVQTENSLSNGLSIWAPRRVEFGGMPDGGGQPTTWLRHLAVHEYRHVAQYAALNRGLVHSLGYLFGEQILLAGSGLMPFWWLEGDATDAETQMTAFGRGLQPSFTMHYRAVGRELLADKNPDIWFGGSYNRHIPSHYHLGYQMVGMANTLKGDYAWDEVIDYVVRYPYTIFATELGMRRRLGYSTKELFFTTFGNLNDHWDALPERVDVATKITPTDSTNYTTYSHPLWVDDSTLVALKGDYDQPARFVEVDVASGTERELFGVGYVNSRPALVGNRLYWTESQQLSSHSQQMGSVLCASTLDGRHRSHPIGREVYALYPVEFSGTLAYVRYNFEGTYTIVCSYGEATMAEGLQICGLAADGAWLYYITLGSSGMAIERMRPMDWRSEVVKPATYATLSDLRAEDGRLFFGSTYSGYDEVHTIDLKSGTESRLTTSRYGSFYGSPSPDGTRLALALYDAYGYHLALAPALPQAEVGGEKMPHNVVNPPRYRWQGVGRVDDVHFGAFELYESKQHHPAKPYRKAANLIDIHSWAPAYFRPDEVMAGGVQSVGVGLMATSQNLLNTAFVTAGYHFLPSSGVHRTTLNLKYVGWWPKIEFSADVRSAAPSSFPLLGVVMDGGRYVAQYDFSEQLQEPELAPGYYGLYGRVSLPVVLSHSHFTSVLTPAVELSHTNNRPFNPYTQSFAPSTTAVGATLQWNGYVRQSVRDLQPRWGATLLMGWGRMAATGIPTPSTLGAMARLYLPGVGKNDGLTLRLGYQDIVGSGPLNYALDFGWLAPRGLEFVDSSHAVWPDEQVALSLQYSSPLCYPDVGITGVVLLKRLRLSAFVDAMAGSKPQGKGLFSHEGVATAGVDLYADTSWLRLPSEADVSLRLSCYAVPHSERVLYPSFGAAINF